MRLFVAIGFDDIALDAIASAQDRLRSVAKKGRFSLRTNLHMTLAFLGEVDEARLADAKSAMDGTVVPRMSITLDDAGSFRRGDGDIWWVGPTEKLVLVQLHDDLQAHLEKAGFEFEPQAFRPHVTIARSVHCDRRPMAAELLPKPIRAQADAIRLMESKRVDGVLVYEELYRKSGPTL